MQVHPQPQASSHPNETNDHNLQQKIPWWDHLASGVQAELDIPPIDNYEQSSIDIVVIGGGVAGLSAAINAQMAGAQVLVLEKELMLGYGATGRNAGILSAGINMGFAQLPPDSPEALFWPETTRVMLTLVEEATQPGALLSAHLTGAISLAKSKNAAQNLAREVRARLAAGLHAELWTPAQVTEATAGRINTQGLVSAMWLPDEGRIHPLTLLAHLAKEARKSGVLIAGQANVTNLQTTNTDHWHITLANGRTIKARGLIKAVGPTVQPVARIFALAFASDLPDTFPLFWDASPYIYADFRPGNGRLCVSGGRYGKIGTTAKDSLYFKELIEKAYHWLPELNKQEPIYRWSVDLDVSANMIPALHPLDERRPGFAIEGLGALGVLPGIILGRRAGTTIARQLS